MSATKTPPVLRTTATDWLRALTVPIALALAAICTVGATWLGPFELFLVGQYAVLVAVTASLVVLMGGAGLLSLSSAAFLAVGAYGTIVLVEDHGVPYPLAVLGAALISGAAGWVLGLVSLRLSGFYLAIVTLGFVQVLLIALRKGGELTGGGYGRMAPPTSIPGYGDLITDDFCLAAVFCAVVVVVCATSLMRSRPGRTWLALRDDEAAARMQGINVGAMKMRAFALSSLVIGFMGGVYAFILGSASPPSFTVDVSIFHIALVVVGGLTGRVSGAILAPILLFLVPEWFDAFGEYRDLFYAGLLLATLVFLPRGLSGLLEKLVDLPAVVRIKKKGSADG